MNLHKDQSSGGRVDFHSHSRASDGLLSPSALAEAAVKIGLQGLALTDHDTVDGVAEFMAAAEAVGLKALGGVEISLEHEGTFHLLGYNVREGSQIPAALDKLKEFRQERNRQLWRKLQELGLRLDWTELMERSAGGQLGRPHFASLMVEKGYVASRQQAFDELLGKGRPAYVDKIRLSLAEGLAMLRQAGWAPVLAHPVSLGLEDEAWPNFLKSLLDQGLVGLETRHPSLGERQTDFFAELAESLGLVQTIGSDFHGPEKPYEGLSWALGRAPHLGWETVEKLRQRLN